MLNNILEHRTFVSNKPNSFVDDSNKIMISFHRVDKMLNLQLNHNLAHPTL